MVVLDSDVIIGALRGNPPDAEYVRSLLSSGRRISTTSVCACEIFRGDDQTDPQAREKTERFLQVLDVLPLGLEAARVYRHEYHQLRASRQAVDDADLLIAAIVIANKETLATRNLKHFRRVPGLELEKITLNY